MEPREDEMTKSAMTCDVTEEVRPEEPQKRFPIAKLEERVAPVTLADSDSFMQASFYRWMQ